jgi:hypothetical protein
LRRGLSCAGLRFEITSAHDGGGCSSIPNPWSQRTQRSIDQEDQGKSRPAAPSFRPPGGAPSERALLVSATQNSPITKPLVMRGPTALPPQQYRARIIELIVSLLSPRARGGTSIRCKSYSAPAGCHQTISIRGMIRAPDCGFRATSSPYSGLATPALSAVTWKWGGSRPVAHLPLLQ